MLIVPAIFDSIMQKLRHFNWYKEFIPVLIWTIIFILPFLLMMLRIIINSNDTYDESNRNIFYSFLAFIGIFYLHTFLIHPIKEKQNGILYYWLLLLGCFLVFLILPMLLWKDFSWVSHTNSLLIHTNEIDPSYLFSIFPFILIIFISYCYRLYLDKIRQSDLIKELETIQLKTELDFLRSQISPHFMFNLMNTLVSMARKKSELIESSLINLSQLIRYMLYDSDGSQISLEKEMEYLKNYINLQLLRFGDDLSFNLFLSGNFEGYKIEPMLLIPFVENAFKHGVRTIKDPLIDVSIDMDGNKRLLHMVVMNNIAEKVNIYDKGLGTGLNNVQRRLELLYPEKHLITVSQKEDMFTIHLEISL
ncbi:MAG: Histidine kinase [Mucilaginibacter sp.]|nr:Histidine kinase [Mucilaginibacter sp.]